MNARGRAGFKMKIIFGCRVGLKMNVYVYVLVYVYLARTELVEFCTAPPASLSQLFFFNKGQEQDRALQFLQPALQASPRDVGEA